MKKLIAFTIFLLLFTSFFTYSQSSNLSNPNIIYLSPVPNSKMNSPLTNIIIRTKTGINNQTINADNLIVKGSKSGLHSGNFIIEDDGKTLIFKPDNKFSPGEIVYVNLKKELCETSGESFGNFNFNFSISSHFVFQSTESSNMLSKEMVSSIEENSLNRRNSANIKMQKVNNPDYNLPSDFPSLYISVIANPSPGYIFLSNFGGVPGNHNSSYLMILDNSGKPFFYKKTSNFHYDFTMQPNGLITYFDTRVHHFYAMNNQFAIVDSFYCGNGYPTDLHELQILPDGHYYIIGDDKEKVDMSKIVAGGDTNATVIGIIIQELDKNKNVVFQWRSWDHFKITDATDDISLTDTLVDCVHTNAIEPDLDGNILISSRNLDEITKINRNTGDIMWRLGGKNNQFTFVNDSIGFSHQHDIRRLPNGDITLFDDGNLHWSKLSSRGEEYKLDENNKTAELVWQFVNSPDEFSAAMGNVQRLDDGSTIIGWGTGSPAITEVSPQGLKEFELSLGKSVINYRAFKFKLDSSYFVTLIPSLDSPQNNSYIEDTAITLKWNKNKFAQSFHLQLAKDSNFANIVYDSSALDVTSIRFDSLEDGIKYYWHVMSDNNTDKIGGCAGYSQTASFTTLLKIPENLSITTSSQANFLTWDINTDNADSIIIERRGGADTSNFNIIAELSKDQNYFVDTSQDTINVLSNKYKYRIKSVNKFSHSGYAYSRVITWGKITGINQQKTNIPVAYSLDQNYPNPFNPSTTINYSITKTSLVTLKVYDVLGREVRTLVNENKPAGNYKFKFNSGNLTSGIYFYRINAGEFSATKKMIVLK